MSEKTIAQAAAETLWDLDAELKAAEERGRRSGVEEGGRAARAAKEVHDYCLYMFQREWLDDPENRSIFAAHIFAILDAALAPRDSGKGET